MLVVKLNFYSTYQCLCVHLLFLAGEKWRLKMYLSLNHSFKSTDSSSNETSKSWVSHWIIEKFHEILFSCLIFFLQNCERTTTFIKKKKQLYFAHKQLLIESGFYVAGWFLFMVFRSNEMFCKKRRKTNIFDWLFVTTLELKMEIDKQKQNWCPSCVW